MGDQSTGDPTGWRVQGLFDFDWAVSMSLGCGLPFAGAVESYPASRVLPAAHRKPELTTGRATMQTLDRYYSSPDTFERAHTPATLPEAA